MPQTLGLILFTLGAPLAVVNAVTIGIGATLISALGTVALSIGVSYAASMLNRPKMPKPSDGQQEIQQPVPVAMFHYGRLKVSGPLGFYASAYDETDHFSLIKIVMLSRREIDAYEVHYLNDAPINRDAGGWITNSQYDHNGPRARVLTHLGTDSQTASSVMQAIFPTWTADHRLRGIAYAVCTFRQVGGEKGPIHFSRLYPSGEPTFTALIRASKVYDPRTDTTAWSDNAALCVLDYLTHSDGYARPIEKIDLPSFAAMADICDELVPLAAGGTEKRYRVATSVYMSEPRKDVLARLLEACDGTLYPTRDGTIAIRGGKYTAPTVTIDADQGHILEARFSPGPDAIERYNELVIQHMSPAHGYTEVEGASWQNTADPDFIDGKIKSEPLELFQVPSHGQARRLAKIRMARDNPEWIGEVRTSFAGLDCIGEAVITLKFPDLGIDGPFWIEDPEWTDDQGGMLLRVRSADPTAYDWTTAEENTSSSVPPDAGEEYEPVAPADVTSVQGVLDGTEVTISWVQPNDPNVGSARIYRNAANDSAGATLLTTVYGGPNVFLSASFPSSGPHYYWVASLSGTDIEGNRIAAGLVG